MKILLAESTHKAIPAKRLIALLAITALLGGCQAIAAVSTLTGCAFRSAPEIQPGSLPDAHVGTPYTATINVTQHNAPVAGIGATGLPEGMELNHENRESHAELIGTPVRAGDYKIQVSAGTYGTMCAGQQAEREISLKVMP